MNSHSMYVSLGATGVLVAMSLVVPAHALDLTGLNLQFGSDSNVGRAQFDDDVLDSSSVGLGLNANLLRRVLANTRATKRAFTLDTSFGYHHDIDFDGLSHGKAGISATFSNEWGEWQLVPIFSLGGSVVYREYDSDLRDGVTTDLFTSINLQPAKDFDVTLGTGLELRQAEADVFSTTKARVFALARFVLNPRVALRAGVSVYVGDEVSSADPSIAAYGASTGMGDGWWDTDGNWVAPESANTAWYADSVWDDALSTDGTNRYAYLVEDATTLLLEIGGGVDITPRVGMDLTARRASTEADGGASYDRTLFEMTIGMRF